MGMTSLSGTLTCQTEAEADMVRAYLPEPCSPITRRTGLREIRSDPKGKPLGLASG
jgi:hypothetical protein